MIPGIDGVGRLDGRPAVYFVGPDDTWGSMAERAVIDLRRVVPLPDGVDVAKVAAAMNPAMSSWVALRRRVPLQPGQSVLVLGATGNAGAMAVQVAKRLGAGRVVGAGRNPERLAELPALGADEVVPLSDDPAHHRRAPGRGGRRGGHRHRLPVGRTGCHRHDGHPPGPSRPQPRPGLGTDRRHGRSHHRAAVGGAPFGQPQDPGQRPGRGSPQAYLAELPSLVDEIDAGTIEVNTHLVPLAEVEAAWNAPKNGRPHRPYPVVLERIAPGGHKCQYCRDPVFSGRAARYRHESWDTGYFSL